MVNYIFVSLILSFISYLYLKVAEKLNIIDKPNHRSSHKNDTIRGGGILFLFSLLLFFIFNDFQYPYFIFGTVLIAIVSFVDDLKTLSSNLRLPFQFIAVSCVFYQLDLIFFPIYLMPLIIIIGVGFINVYNFMDGINGITGLYSISILIGFYLINNEINVVSNELIIYLFISLLVFGFYNFRKKARFFAGDIGSITIAMAILFLGLILVKESKSPLILFSIVVYGADTILTMFYRKYKKEKLSEAHRLHIYQKVVDVLKVSHLKVSISYFAIQLIVNLIIYFCFQLDIMIQITIMISLSIFFVLLYMYLFKYLDNRLLN